jgi:hypothetical protein
MEPLRVMAVLAGQVSLPGGTLALDSLLAAAVAQREGLPPASVGGYRHIDVPLEWAPGRRFHLASFAAARWEAHDVRYVNRRFPLDLAQDIGDMKLRRVNLSGGPTKSYRIPLEAGLVVDDTLEWWCVGDSTRVESLLSEVTHVGKRRGVGLGQVLRWEVVPVTPWGDGFPVVRDGKALRPLPPDWPGLEVPELAYGCLTYPYWDRAKEELVAVPEVAPC